MSKQYLKYGLTLEEYSALLELCQNKCMICGAAPKNRALAVDHFHGLGFKNKQAVRGILCYSCNRFVVGKNNDPALLRKAADYLERYNKSLPSKRRQKADKIFKFSDR